jgi:hypothetical protein
MFYQLTQAKITKEELGEREAKYGGYNSPPPGWQELTVDEFAATDFFTYGFVEHEYRQFPDPERFNGSRSYQTFMLFFMHAGHGYAICRSFESEIKYFRFGCKHAYRGLDVQECRDRKIPHYGRGWHVGECIHCGHIHSYDSSD